LIAILFPFSMSTACVNVMYIYIPYRKVAAL
jgi:hypothetical protein